MAGKSNFKVFAESATEILNDTDYEANTQRTNGVTPGIASPNLHNKLYRQATIMATALAQVIAEKGFTAMDTAYSLLVAGIKNTFVLSVGGNVPDADGNIAISVNGNKPDANGNIKVPDGLTLLDIYPVGSVYFSSVKAFSPATKFGGTWSLVEEGRFIRAAGNNIAALATGGADTVALGVANLPPHSHTASCSTDGWHSHTGWTSVTGAHHHGTWGEHYSPDDWNHLYGLYDSNANHIGSNGDIDWDNYILNTSTDGNHNHSFTTDGSGSHSHTISISDTGSGQAFSILPRWIALYMWVRTA